MLYLLSVRSTPVETLHTILLGPYKYLLKSTIPKLSARQKEEVLARIRSFNYSGFHVRLIGNVVRYHKSFVGRDYKAWGQMALFIICPYLNEQEVRMWLTLSKVRYENNLNNIVAHVSQLSCRYLRLPIVTTSILLRRMSGIRYVRSS